MGDKDVYFVILPVSGWVESGESQFWRLGKGIGVHLCP
jgi:hypothetical protein